MKQTVRSHCRICTNQCGVSVTVEDDTITRVRGDFDHPLSKGYTCPKGRALGRLHHHPEAIGRPFMRRAGALQPASWEECLDDIASRLKSVVSKYGPQAIGFYFGSGLGMDAAAYRMGEAFHTALGHSPKFSPVTIDGAAKVLVSSLVGGFPGLTGKTDNENVDMLLYVGVNPVVSHGHNTGMFNPAGPIRAIAERGEVWTIDPLRTETARFSTRHLRPWPGRDHAVLAWLVREVIEGGPLAPAQQVQQLEQLRAALEGYDRVTAARVSGISEDDLAGLLAAVRRHGGVTVETGTGVTMTETANLTQWFAWLLNILTGRMNSKGGVWFHPGFIHQFDSFELPLMNNPFTPGAPTMPHVNGIIGEWPCAALPGEIEAGNIRALINLGGSIVRSFPDANRLVPALRQLDTFVTFEIAANETTALSTHVLPTKDQLERPDISFWDTLSGSLSMLYSPAVVKPSGERRSGWWSIARIMAGMGLALPDDLPEDDQTAGADEEMLARQMAGARCSFEELKETGTVSLPLEFPGRWVDAHIERIGGWLLAPEVLVEEWQRQRQKDDRDGDPPLSFIPRRQRRKLNTSLSFLGSPADIILHPGDAAKAGIADGDMVRVSSTRGEIELTACVDDSIRPGVASIPHGHEIANVNYLTSCDAVDPMTGMVLYSGIPIGIEAVAGRTASGQPVVL
ncbi:molybdopterin-containing oxidoreductase family protein [Novosphingobium beihaiensis]|uniref:Molybdopterin-dependent oxidoreductase n=1 Tax=Novosphingobium beihaiensis TaxID=2930389 RepID=A0ABT0BRN6_9SPHN|nr:molybdopterin-dependent oxidoreductase [Novosphingobium beihaiensis]MCJ2187691.1 molybdopterin-dependent oxidoreductase [Novosphingobium beihaiensis]